MEEICIPDNDFLSNNLGDELNSSVAVTTYTKVFHDSNWDIGVPEGMFIIPNAIASFSL